MFYMFLADGFEETEALVTLDMLRRAGVEIKTVGIGSTEINGTHGIRVIADLSENEVELSLCDGIILPGGMPGTENLYSSPVVGEAVGYCFNNNNKLICAICAAPVILGRKGLLKGHRAVCFPGFENELEAAEIDSSACVKSGNIITARGAGCVFEFSYEIIRAIKDKQTADKVIAVIQHKGL